MVFRPLGGVSGHGVPSGESLGKGLGEPPLGLGPPRGSPLGSGVPLGLPLGMGGCLWVWTPICTHIPLWKAPRRPRGSKRHGAT